MGRKNSERKRALQQQAKGNRDAGFPLNYGTMTCPRCHMELHTPPNYTPGIATPEAYRAIVIPQHAPDCITRVWWEKREAAKEELV